MCDLVRAWRHKTNWLIEFVGFGRMLGRLYFRLDTHKLQSLDQSRAEVPIAGEYISLEMRVVRGSKNRIGQFICMEDGATSGRSPDDVPALFG